MRTVIALFSGVLLFAPEAALAYQGSLTGSGARAMGMGGAFIAVADDATAISWNPAGLTRLDAPEAGLAVTLGSGSWNVDLPSAMSSEFSLDIEEETSLSLNFASGVIPFKLGERHAVAAIGYRRYWDQTQKTTQTFTYMYDQYYNGVYYDQSVQKNDANGAVIALSPALAVQLSPMISLGATLSLMTGSYESDLSNRFLWYGEEVASDASNSSSSYSGFTADVGALVDLSPKVRVGAVASLPWTLTIGDFESDGISYDDVEQKLPAFLGAGIAVKPTPMLTIALDARHHPWSKVELDGETPYPEWSDATVIRTGLEYLLVGETTVIPLRAGFYSEPTPERDAEDEQLKTTAFTVGAGLILGRLTVDACYVRASTPFMGSVDYEPVDFEIVENLFTISGVLHFGTDEE